MTTTPPPAVPGLFPKLCPPLHRIGDTSTWHYPSAVSDGGTARLRAWVTRRGYLTVITHQAGTTPADAPRQVHRALRDLFRDGDLVIIEHVPDPDDSAPYGHWDQLTVTRDGKGRGHWRRVWPVPPSSPDRLKLRAWVTASATALGIPEEAFR
jgi:hypothetical protein